MNIRIIDPDMHEPDVMFMNISVREHQEIETPLYLATSVSGYRNELICFSDLLLA